MTDINEIDLRLIDATILMVFLGLMRHRKATAVAQDMGLTQPAISYALKRLRRLYDDPLFLRRAHGLEPTALARDLEPKVRQVIGLLSETLGPRDTFDHRLATQNLKIGVFDFEAVTLIPDLVAHLRRHSPNMHVHALPITDRAALDALSDGRLDLAIGYFDFVPTDSDNFMITQLYTDHYVAAARQGHPLFAAGLSPKSFTAAEHLVISPSGPVRTLVDHALQMQGLTRNIHNTVPSLFAALSILERSDVVLTLPSRVAAKNTQRFHMTFQPLPVDCGSFALNMVYHRRDATSAMHKWLVDRIHRLAVDSDMR